MDLLVLATIGARSGRVRENRVAFIRHGQDPVVAGSNYGSPASPHWYHNLVANPVVTVEVYGERIQARARVARGLEREMLYALLAQRMPGFLQAQRRTGG
ncbi:MAG TPA: nitroreductase/quinone reductase family protein [Candidatus Dormibacteraeota bacterium]|nr:nitroreductase/quinone reductase family protein [Candidatus Dormibacteraeota bacterium]